MVVRRLDGVEEALGDAEKRTLAVRFDPVRASVERIQEALLAIGYDASILE